MSIFHSLRISNLRKLTPNAVALTFEVPAELQQDYAFSAGQYLTLKHKANGQELRRSYSISSAPSSGQLTVGIKKLEGGTFSVYANTELQEGDRLEVMIPEGRFTYTPTGKAQQVAAFAAGSGITPIMAIAQTVLESHTESHFVLVYGNQRLSEAMYLEEILKLKEQYGDRFFVQLVTSREQEADTLFGRIEPSIVNFILKNKFKDTTFDAVYVCGPEAMIESTAETLEKGGVAKENIHFERFTTQETEDTLAQNLEGKTQVTVTLDDEVETFTMDRKQLVLDAVLKADMDAPYSCQGGICSSCLARVVEGKVEMVNNQILTDGEIAEGLILTCQAHPLTPTLKIDYDDV